LRIVRRLDIAVIGGGNGSYAAAADLAEAGHQIRLWRRDADLLQPLLKSATLELLDHRGPRLVTLDLVSADISEAVDGADLILVPLPAPSQVDVATALAPHLSDGQVVFAPPGTLGSYLMASTVATHRPGLDVAWAEAGTLPFLARKRGPTSVAVSARATRLPTGVFPSRRRDRAFDVLSGAFPAVEPLVDALDAALTNAGPIIHPPLIVLNAAPIEHFEHWDIHAEGTQPAVRRVQDALDAERVAVRCALRYPAPHYPLRDHYEADGDEWMYGNAAHERLVESGDWRERLDLVSHRYVTEDVFCGLALLVSIGDLLDMELPVARGLYSVTTAFAGPELHARARTLEALGLANLSPGELRDLLEQGPA
jgi:opine dehydrogenase